MTTGPVFTTPDGDRDYAASAADYNHIAERGKFVGVPSTPIDAFTALHGTSDLRNAAATLSAWANEFLTMAAAVEKAQAAARAAWAEKLSTAKKPYCACGAPSCDVCHG